MIEGILVGIFVMLCYIYSALHDIKNELKKHRK